LRETKRQQLEQREREREREREILEYLGEQAQGLIVD
jgi:hypothetical protein